MVWFKTAQFGGIIIYKLDYTLQQTVMVQMIAVKQFFLCAMDGVKMQIECYENGWERKNICGVHEHTEPGERKRKL